MIGIIDYNAGNLTSVARAVNHIGFNCKITSQVKEIENCERIIFPGVGAAGTAMKSLKSYGLDNTIKDAFIKGKPILGICLGAQIIMEYSKENDTKCIGIINGHVENFPCDLKSENESLKIPQMGWNRINICYNHPVFSGIRENDEFYFVHSFYPKPDNKENIYAITSYGIFFPSVIGYKNIIAAQFHPEKSGRPGLLLLKNFCNWKI